MTDLLDRHDLDTWLALSLLREGRLAQPIAQELLQSARADRAQGGASLARTLVVRGLFSQAELERFLAQSTLASTSAGVESAPPLQRLGPYDLLQELGAGGMGKVYRARHRETGGECALKTLLSIDPEGLERFQREGQGQARVDEHPNVVKVHTLSSEGGTHYLVMDLIEGGSLDDRLRANGLPDPRQAAGWVRDLAGAIEFAHQRGVLHRDIKPANVLFDGDRPLLVDFGLVKLADARSLTETGTVLGTPGYMAPEQVDGRRGLTGPATDVYGLGALLYRCLTGRAPFAAATVWLSMIQVLEEPPLRPRELRPDLEPALEAVCLRCLEKDPAKRYPSAAALSTAIDQALGDGAGPSSSLLTARGKLLALTLFAAFVAVVGFATWDPAGREVSKLGSPTPARSSTPRASPSPSPTPSPSEQPPPLVVVAQLPLLSGPHIYDPVIIRRLRRDHEAQALRQALLRARRVLSGPISGGTPKMHRIAARLMLDVDDSPRSVDESRQAIVHAALHGDAHAALTLANHHLPTKAREREYLLVQWRREPRYVREDLPLAAAALGLARHWERNQARKPTHMLLTRLIKKVRSRSVRIPRGQAAHDVVWRACPEGRVPLPPVEPPTEREAVWSTLAPRRSERAVAEYLTARKAGRPVSLDQLADEFRHLPGRVSGKIFRELAGGERAVERQLDFLARAAVAGDGPAAILLARAFGAEVPEIDTLGWSLARQEPDDELARACLVLTMLTREDGMKLLAAPLLGNVSPTAKEIRAAYRVLWERFPGAR